MTRDSLQVGWDWIKVKDLSYWQIPDGYVMNLPYYIPKPPAKILDLGCGVGRHTIYFASLGFDVISFDISNDAITATKKWLDKEGLTAQLEIGKMTELNHSDNTFDLVVAFNVIYHAYKHDVIKTIEEIFRVLKPGGYFFGTLLTKDPQQQFSDGTVVVDKQTLIKQEEPEVGVPHFFFYIEDVLNFFKKFEIKDLFYKEWYSSPYTIERINNKKGNGHYILFAQKPIEKQ
ncbi:MAG: class I SAM-dependent methyltransferase [Asgard group archaeon]|nr:class I SAM-dependent methyltransferase [Asgard group archaeon]